MKILYITIVMLLGILILTLFLSLFEVINPDLELKIAISAGTVGLVIGYFMLIREVFFKKFFDK